MAVSEYSSRSISDTNIDKAAELSEVMLLLRISSEMSTLFDSSIWLAAYERACTGRNRLNEEINWSATRVSPYFKVRHAFSHSLRMYSYTLSLPHTSIIDLAAFRYCAFDLSAVAKMKSAKLSRFSFAKCRHIRKSRKFCSSIRTASTPSVDWSVVAISRSLSSSVISRISESVYPAFFMWS